jgi:Family of unknown function (DUF5681)
MLKEVYRPVTVRDGERTVRMSTIAAIFRSQLVSGLKGNGPAQRASRGGKSRIFEGRN